MDRLLNVKRTDGYPWCAEEIEILEKRGDYLNALLDSLRLPAKSCVFVQKNTDGNGKLKKSVVYIVDANKQGELYELEEDNEVKVEDLLNATSVKRDIGIRRFDYSVFGAQDVEWDRCYRLKTVTLGQGATYTFYDLNDLLRPAVWRNIGLGENIVICPSGRYGIVSDMVLKQGYNQKMRENGSEIEIDLMYEMPEEGSIGAYDLLFHAITSGMPEIDDMGFPLNVVQMGETGLVTTWGYVTNEGVYFKMPDQEHTVSRYVRVFGHVLLK
ncbi:MAG: hypothetical protein IJU33_00145 [Bacteroidales bacterium]|nr:hypothetical protein [Bacteroidales bacterium]